MNILLCHILLKIKENISLRSLCRKAVVLKSMINDLSSVYHPEFTAKKIIKSVMFGEVGEWLKPHVC